MGLSKRLITEEIYTKGKLILENMSQTNRAAIRLIPFPEFNLVNS